jgi:hypothetical protein
VTRWCQKNFSSLLFPFGIGGIKIKNKSIIRVGHIKKSPQTAIKIKKRDSARTTALLCFVSGLEIYYRAALDYRLMKNYYAAARHIIFLWVAAAAEIPPLSLVCLLVCLHYLLPGLPGGFNN